MAPRSARPLPDSARPPLPTWIQEVGVQALLEIFDYLPETAAFIKDRAGRYVYANRTLEQRLQLKGGVRGLGAQDVFPAALGHSYAEQDRAVLGGAVLTEHLELHLYPGGQTGWCLTTKRALRNGGGETLGLLGVSRDIHVHSGAAPGLAAALTHIQQQYAQPVQMHELAALAGTSLSSFERQVKRVYGVTPTQLVMRARVDAATRLLRDTDLAVARVAVECGYFDHSAFTRVFKAAVGLTPGQFRELKN